LRIFAAADISLLLFFYLIIILLINYCEYDGAPTENQVVNRIYDVFTAIEQ